MIARTKEVLRAGFFKWPLSDKLQTNIYRPREVFKVVDIACQPLFARDLHAGLHARSRKRLVTRLQPLWSARFGCPTL